MLLVHVIASAQRQLRYVTENSRCNFIDALRYLGPKRFPWNVALIKRTALHRGHHSVKDLVTSICGGHCKGHILQSLVIIPLLLWTKWACLSHVWPKFSPVLWYICGAGSLNRTLSESQEEKPTLRGTVTTWNQIKSLNRHSSPFTSDHQFLLYSRQLSGKLSNAVLYTD